MNLGRLSAWIIAGLAVAPAALAGDKPTFSKDIAPLFYKNCVACHRAGEIGPMSLMTYEETRPWAKSIQKAVVQEKKMPPWHSVDPKGTFANDRRLTDDQIALVDQWVKAGAPEGDKADMPPAPVFKEGWLLGEPDYVIELEPFSVAADGPDQFMNLFAKLDLPEDKWVTAVEIRPSSRKVVHHVIALTEGSMKANQENQTNAVGINGWLAGWAAGTQPQEFTKGTGRLLKKDEAVIANMHYHPNGEAATDTTKIGLHFADKPVERESRNQWVVNATFKIPAGDGNHEVTSTYTVPEDSEILTVTPHMHFRGKDMIISAVFPDGRTQTLINVPKYDFNWQTIYELAKPVHAPKGTRIDVLAHFDNSPENKANPDPTKDIVWGPQTTDEMLIGIVDLVPVAKLAQAGASTGQ